MLLFPSPSSSPSSKSFVDSNLQKFLDTVTPFVSSKPILKKSLNTNLTSDKAPGNYFQLKDLWECFEEWSAFGVGVPVLLEDGDTIDQFYTPYLSAVELYTIEDPEIVLRPKGLRSQLARNKPLDVNGVVGHPDAAPVDEFSLRHLYFQYGETEPPYCRKPIKEKIASFCQQSPGILSLKSVDLAPASWMSILWNPIYHIPMNAEVPEYDLSIPFLTYHKLSTFCDVGESVEDLTEEVEKIGLHAFAMATLDMETDVWIDGDDDAEDKICYLYNAAEEWLDKVDYEHHDFMFLGDQF